VANFAFCCLEGEILGNFMTENSEKKTSCYFYALHKNQLYQIWEVMLILHTALSENVQQGPTEVNENGCKNV